MNGSSDAAFLWVGIESCGRPQGATADLEPKNIDGGLRHVGSLSPGTTFGHGSVGQSAPLEMEISVGWRACWPNRVPKEAGLVENQKIAVYRKIAGPEIPAQDRQGG